MALTFDQIYDRNQCLNAITRIDIKRINTSDVYESTWKDIESLTNNPIRIDTVLNNVTYKIPKDSYNFGAVEIPDCKLQFNSVNGDFADEEDSRSIFYGYKRHMSLIRIMFGYEDSRTGDVVMEEEYRGFINNLASGTKVNIDNTIQILQIDDLLTTLIKKYTYADITPTQTTLNNLIYEIFNRSEFTDFMTVSAGNINAGYNIPSIAYTTGVDPTWYDNEQIFTFLQGLSTGHSFLYQKAGVLYYQPISPQPIVLRTFDESKIVKFSKFGAGADKVYEKLYWKDTNTKWEASPMKYGRVKTFDIKGIVATVQRQAFLAAVGTKISKEHSGFMIEIPLYPKINVLDRIQVIAGDYVTQDAFILDKSRLDIDYLRDYYGASYVDETQAWLVKEVKHNHTSMVTKITVQGF